MTDQALYSRPVTDKDEIKNELLELHPFEDLKIIDIRDLTDEEQAGLAQYKKELH